MNDPGTPDRQESIATAIRIPGFSYWNAREQGLRALRADQTLSATLWGLWVNLRAHQRQAQDGARASQPEARRQALELMDQITRLAQVHLNPPLTPLWIAHTASAQAEVRRTAQAYLLSLEATPPSRQHKETP